MEGGGPKAFCGQDDDPGCVWDVHPDLDDCGCDKDVELLVSELLHDVALLVGLHLSMNFPYLETRQGKAGEVLGGGVYAGGIYLAGLAD